MPAKTKIEWADYISNPIKARRSEDGKQGHACVKVSEGCAHCWASAFNTRLGTGLEYTKPHMERVELYLDDDEVERIYKFKPRLPKGASTFKNGRSRAVVFPCDMTDVFGDFVPDAWINRLFAAFASCAEVDWFVLTKRSARMMRYCADRENGGFQPWGNIYLGCTVENQARAVERCEAMRAVSEMGWKTLVSFEPVLEIVNWEGWQFLNGLICGGESGVNARPMPPEAARDARDFCAAHGIPFFFKQWGEWLPLDHMAWVTDETTFKHRPVKIYGTIMCRVGKGLGGRVLDGETHLEVAG